MQGPSPGGPGRPGRAIARSALSHAGAIARRARRAIARRARRKFFAGGRGESHRRAETIQNVCGGTKGEEKEAAPAEAASQPWASLTALSGIRMHALVLHDALGCSLSLFSFLSPLCVGCMWNLCRTCVEFVSNLCRICVEFLSNLCRICVEFVSKCVSK